MAPSNDLLQGAENESTNGRKRKNCHRINPYISCSTGRWRWNQTMCLKKPKVKTAQRCSSTSKTEEKPSGSLWKALTFRGRVKIAEPTWQTTEGVGSYRVTFIQQQKHEFLFWEIPKRWRRKLKNVECEREHWFLWKSERSGLWPQTEKAAWQFAGIMWEISEWQRQKARLKNPERRKLPAS